MGEMSESFSNFAIFKMDNMIIGKKTDIEKVLIIADNDAIVDFCEQYALHNKEFANALTSKFLSYDGDNTNERIASIDKELAKCFKFKLKGSRSKKWGPYLDWTRIENNLWGQIQKGEMMLNQGYVQECIYLAIEMLRQISVHYFKDEVWNDQEYDGDKFCSDDAIDFLLLALNANELTMQDLEDISDKLQEISTMKANEDYGLIDLSEIDEIIEAAQLNLQSKNHSPRTSRLWL